MGFRLEPSQSAGSQSSKFFFEPSECNWEMLKAAAATLTYQINHPALNSTAAHSPQTKQGSPITSEASAAADSKQLVHKAPSIELLDQGTAETQTAEVVGLHSKQDGPIVLSDDDADTVSGSHGQRDESDDESQEF